MLAPTSTARLLPLALAALLAAGCAATRNERPLSTAPITPPASAPASQPSVLELSKHPVVGMLRVPLGTVVEIRATVVAGTELESKEFDSKYLLRVKTVDGYALADSPVLEFSVPAFVMGVDLANNDFSLYELRTGTKTGELRSAQVKELKRGYVGKQVRLVAYETGRYSGMPVNLPDDVPSWQDHGFEFSTSLVVLAERK